VGETSQPIARRTNVSGQSEVRAWRERTASDLAACPRSPRQRSCRRTTLSDFGG
jgi:hypothetical protein